MNYHNRMISSPDYINRNNSPFWAFVANSTSQKLKEDCEHSKNYLNKRVYCAIGDGYLLCFVSCKKCDRAFLETNKAMLKNIGHFGF
jgi:hypothetical protein